MFIKKNLRALEVYKPGKPIEEVRRALGLKKIYKLASNEIPFSPSYIKKAVNKELKNINRYPEASCFCLRAALAKRLKVKRQQLVFGNGSDELIVMAIRALTKNSSNVVVGFPTFIIYEIQAKASGIKVKRVPFAGFRYDYQAVASSVDRNTAIVFIANPDSPHGTYLNKKEMAKFLKAIPREVVVFIDEAYYEFAARADFPDSLYFLKKRGNIIITRTFSKAYGLAGLRIGYAITTPQIADLLNKVREPFNINRFAQVAALEALGSRVFLNKITSYIRNQKHFLYKQLKALGVDYLESATNFIMINFKSDTKELYKYLLKKGVIIRDLNSWGLKNCFRLTVGLHRENKAFVKYFREYLDILRRN